MRYINRMKNQEKKTINKPVVEIDTKKCQNLAQLLNSLSIPLDKEDIDLKNFSHVEIGNFYLFLVAICHQTSPPGKLPLEGTINGYRKRGWDYLSAKFEENVYTNRSLLEPSCWFDFTTEQMSSLYRDTELGDRLLDPERRALLIRDLGFVMQTEGWHWVEEIYQFCKGRVTTGKPNLLNTLAKFKAYNDPIRKKSLFLLSLMRNTGLWKYPDESKLGPPIDYHEVRGHLRIGTVKVNSEELNKKLMDAKPVSCGDDLEIRGAVYGTIMLISELTGLRNPSQLHYMFWNVFRSCCKRESPHCKGCPPNCSLPIRYVPMAIHQHGYRQCPFSSVCASVNITYRYQEHVFETEYY